MNPNTTWSPGCNHDTFSPTSSTTPAPSWPPMIGSSNGRSPVTRCSSEWHIQDAASFTSTSPGPGASSSTSSTLQSVFVSHRIAAFVFTCTPTDMVDRHRRAGQDRSKHPVQVNDPDELVTALRTMSDADLHHVAEA